MTLEFFKNFDQNSDDLGISREFHQNSDDRGISIKIPAEKSVEPTLVAKWVESMQLMDESGKSVEFKGDIPIFQGFWQN